MARPKSDRELRYRRTTVDLPRLMERQMREAAWQHCRKEDGKPSGMLQRYLIKAVERSLTQDGLWPITLENMPPPSAMEAIEAKVAQWKAEGKIPPEGRASGETRIDALEGLTKEQLWPGLYGKDAAVPVIEPAAVPYTPYADDAQTEADEDAGEII